MAIALAPIPAARRTPSLAVTACAVAMPLVLFGAFESLARAPNPSVPVQFWMIAAGVVSQWILYGIGLLFLYRLGTHCPRPATPAGWWIATLGGGGFIVFGGVWCVGCAALLYLLAATPW